MTHLLDILALFLPILGIAIIVGRNLQIISQNTNDIKNAFIRIRNLEVNERRNESNITKTWMRLGFTIEQLRDKDDLDQEMEDYLA